MCGHSASQILRDSLYNFFLCHVNRWRRIGSTVAMPSRRRLPRVYLLTGAVCLADSLSMPDDMSLYRLLLTPVRSENFYFVCLLKNQTILSELERLTRYVCTDTHTYTHHRCRCWYVVLTTPIKMGGEAGGGEETW